MSATTDLERTLATWLERDGPADVPERVIAAALAEARTVRQRRAWLTTTWWATRASRKDGAMKPTPSIDRYRAHPELRRPLRLLWIAALIGLLLAGTAVVALVGNELVRRSDDLSVVVPLPIATASPTIVAPSATPVVTSSAFGPITWHTLDALDIPDPSTVVGTPLGLVAATDVGLRLLAPDGTSQRIPLDGPEVFGSAVVVDDDLLVGGAEPRWLRRSGSSWVVGEQIDFPGALEDTPAAVAAGPRGIVVQRRPGGFVHYSTDGIRFERAKQAPDKAKLEGRVGECDTGYSSWSASDTWRVGPVIATDDGFVAFSAADPDSRSMADPICEPVLWFSADGSVWELVSPISPFGPGAYVVEVASRGGRHVAVGGDGAFPPGSAVVWVSDDGLTWDRLSTLVPGEDCPSCGQWPSRVVAGDPGWVILSSQGDVWISTDGRTWQELIGAPKIREGGWRRQDLALASGSVYIANPLTDGIVIGTFGP